MSYPIKNSAGATLATIQDGTVNNSATSLTLIGKNYAGYGNFLNENLVYLLENFSKATAPTNAITGQLWYDNVNQVLKLYSGSAWKPISSSAASAVAPSNPVTGDLWWNTTTTQLYVWSGTAWVLVGPAYSSESGTSGAVVQTILDSGSNPHVVVEFFIQNNVIAILSQDAAFTPQTAIAGFTTVNPGFNLISSSTLPNSQFTGSVSNALTLQGVNASQFLRSDQNTSTSYVITAGGGVTVGSDLNIVPTPATNEVQLYNTTNGRNLNIYVTQNGNKTQAIGIAASTSSVTFANTVTVGGAILPNANNTLNIGAAATTFANVYATNFIGLSTTAQYADLAERFEADASYAPGTVVELGGVNEITAVGEDLSEAVFGVISTKAAFLMNGLAGVDATHPPVAVSGRVPVRVIGQVRKGDRLVAAGAGLARAASRTEITAFNVIGRALENKTTTEEGVVEAIVKLNS